MSEYWKSTPKYWCKYCNTFVRDTKLERSNHEATPKHQGNLKRFLRDLHRGHEKDQKDKERAKSEVARLNGLIGGGDSTSGAGSSRASIGAASKPSVSNPQITPAQRKQQLAQLAEMGVSIPDEFRPDMAMAGEWQVTSERVVDHDRDKNPEALALGVRKRQVDEDEAELIEAKKRRWGSSYRTHPVAEEDGDLDALLSNVTRKDKEPPVKREHSEGTGEIRNESLTRQAEGEQTIEDVLPAHIGATERTVEIKREPLDGDSMVPESTLLQLDVKQEEGDKTLPEVIFKKRKAMNVRQK